MNNYRLDSLEQEINKRDVYFETMRRIIAGEKPADYAMQPDSQPAPRRVQYSKRDGDSLIRDMARPSDQFGLSIIETRKARPALFNVLFFPPVKGIVTSSFNSAAEHYGTDIVAGADEVVKATLPGTVTIAGMDPGNG